MTSDKSPRPLATINVGILKFFKTILRPWQAGVLKNEIVSVNGACHFDMFAIMVAILLSDVMW